jgi:hypothetical protein
MVVPRGGRGPQQVAARPTSPPEILAVVRQLLTRTESWLAAVALIAAGSCLTVIRLPATHPTSSWPRESAAGPYAPDHGCGTDGRGGSAGSSDGVAAGRRLSLVPLLEAHQILQDGAAVTTTRPARTRRGSLLALIVLVAASACGSPFLGVAETPKIWVGKTPTSAVMVQLTRVENSLTGALDETSVDGETGTSVEPVHLAFTGIVQDDAITLSFPGGLGTFTNLSGTMTRSTMTLQVPQDDGSVAALELRPGSVDDYNSNVAALHEQAGDNSAREAQAVAEQQAAEQLRRQQAEVTSAADMVIADLAALKTALAHPPSFTTFDGHLRDAKDHLAATKKNVATAAGMSDPYDACNCAYDAQNSAYDVANSGYDINTDMDDLDSAISAINDAAVKLKDDLATYDQTAAKLPSFVASRVPNVSDITATIKTAETKTAAWKKSGRSFQSQAATLTRKATDIAQTAQKRYCQ